MVDKVIFDLYWYMLKNNALAFSGKENGEYFVVLHNRRTGFPKWKIIFGEEIKMESMIERVIKK